MASTQNRIAALRVMWYGKTARRQVRAVKNNLLHHGKKNQE
jgi:hypothetical protein